MHGFLDDLNQAFFTLDIAGVPLDIQVDTGFNGTLIVGEELFDPTTAVSIGAIKAELADEHIASYESFAVVIKWFGEESPVQVLVGPGKTCLLGTDMLNPHRLVIDYGQNRWSSRRTRIGSPLDRITCSVNAA